MNVLCLGAVVAHQFLELSLEDTFVCATHLIIPLQRDISVILMNFSMFDFRTKRDGDTIVEVIKDGVLMKKTVNGQEQPLGSLPSGSSGRKIKNK